MGQQVTEMLVRMGQQGQIRGKVTDEALKGLLDQVRSLIYRDAGSYAEQ